MGKGKPEGPRADRGAASTWRELTAKGRAGVALGLKFLYLRRPSHEGARRRPFRPPSVRRIYVETAQGTQTATYHLTALVDDQVHDLPSMGAELCTYRSGEDCFWAPLDLGVAEAVHRVGCIKIGIRQTD